MITTIVTCNVCSYHAEYDSQGEALKALLKDENEGHLQACVDDDSDEPFERCTGTLTTREIKG